MNKFKKSLITGAAATAMLLQTALPAFAATTLTISGNGSGSDNDANVSVTRTTSVVQDNTSDIDNTVDVDANTGDNEANDNTGGGVEIKTGDSDVQVSVATETNTNVAEVNNCCGQDAEVLISGNGTESFNDAELTLVNTNTIYQNNNAIVDNDVDVDSDTGDNEANDNTGGDVSVDTGDSDVQVDVVTSANTNVATSTGNGTGASVSAKIMDNGSDTDNFIGLTHIRSTLLTQDNDADVDNDIDVDSETGDNEAEDNTSGEVMIKTGNADIKVLVDNMLNFNAADLDCDCILDVEAKIAGNGTDSLNDINATLSDALINFQTNEDDTDNDVDVESETGDNDANDNSVGSENGDPSIETGDADATVEVYNSNNVNQLGDVSLDGFDLGGNSISVTFDLTAFLSALLGL